MIARFMAIKIANIAISIIRITKKNIFFGPNTEQNILFTLYLGQKNIYSLFSSIFLFKFFTSGSVGSLNDVNKNAIINNPKKHDSNISNINF